MKTHFKLYKAGKMWLTACLVTMGIGLATVAAPQAVHAADTAAVTTTTSVATATQQTTTTDQQQTTDQQTSQQEQATVPTTINGYTRQANNTWQNAAGQTPSGWQTEGSNWYYFKNGTNTTGWQSVNNTWYYMNTTSSAMETGLQTINNATYYLNEQHDGTYGAMKTGWQIVNGHWYYFENNGAAHTGWGKLAGQWYYFDPANQGQMLAGLQTINNRTYYLNEQHDGTYGAMQTGWQQINGKWYGFGGADDGAAYNDWHFINGRWYYFLKDGQGQTGWSTINGHRYYFDDTNAWALTGWQALGDSWYYFDTVNAWMETNWHKIGNHWFYLSPETGAMLTGIQKLADATYYLNEQHDGTYGAMQTGWQQIDGSHYYFQDNGAAALGWQSIGGSKYYFDPATAQAATGITKIGDHYYAFDSNSGAQETGLVYNSATGLLQYYDLQTGERQTQFNADGKTYTFDAATGDLNTADLGLTAGINRLASHLYYFNRATNTFAHDFWYKDANGWYYFGDNGSTLTDWQKINNRWYCFNNDGVARTGWYKTAAGNWYYFDDTNAWALTGWQKINNNWYYFDPENAWADFVGHNWYYFDPVNANMYTGTHWIDGHKVTLQSWGGFVGFSQRVINWFLDREGKLTYSLYGSRTGRDGTADCSGSMTMAVWSAGGSRPALIYSTDNIGSYLLANGYYLAGSGRGVQDVRYGDIVVWGNPGHSAGGAGHVSVISTGGSNPMCISTNAYYGDQAPWGHGNPNMAVQEFNYQWYWQQDDCPYQMVYRPNFYWA
ncbi:peptidoglycan amidohydrolase family protein [Limosilactobacillus kribbianus]|uniref:peptidoglycan amidohydrolase family protein n=1 Tax=Limosilactobacillus kribbianus TaxID=2982695 RepID=UPI00226546E4|nr:peptidoglycan amidohydrolase family protein [Limosilactobacillus kribbianus]